MEKKSKKKKIKVPCGGFVLVGVNLLGQDGVLICTKGHEHSIEEIKQYLAKFKKTK